MNEDRQILNNTNRNSGRRRGRSNNNNSNRIPNSNGRSNENQGNRIDNRARGNATQLLDKYKKLANDAHMNGDRVNAEYYLQFADHYFRVLADNRNRQEENMRSRNDYRDQPAFEGVGPDYDMRDDGDEGDSDEGDGQDNISDNRFSSPNGREQQNYQPRDNQQRDNTRRFNNDRNRNDRGNERNGGERTGNGRAPDAEPVVADTETAAPAVERRPRRPRRDPAMDAPAVEPAGFDASILPPAISAGEDVPAKPKRTITRRPRKVADEAVVAE